MNELDISLLPECALMCYLIFKTPPFNIDPYKHLFRTFESIIHIVTCMNVEFTGINLQYIYFQTVY